MERKRVLFFYRVKLSDLIIEAGRHLSSRSDIVSWVDQRFIETTAERDDTVLCRAWHRVKDYHRRSGGMRGSLDDWRFKMFQELDYLLAAEEEQHVRYQEEAREQRFKEMQNAEEERQLLELKAAEERQKVEAGRRLRDQE